MMETMIRAIDATELKTAFPLGEYVRTECVQATIDHMQTIEAIPIEWLNQKYAENDPDSGNEDFDRHLWDSICYVLTAWKEKQESESNALD